METLFNYDSRNPKSIEKYAEKLIGHTFNEVEYWAQSNSTIKEENFTYDSKSRKGGLGNFIEERFFGYKANSDSRADFSEAGVEIKVTPYEIKSNNKLTAGERLVLTMINFDKKVEKDFYKSHLWEKCKLMLLIFYLRNKALASNMDYRIDYVSLFTFPQKDMAIILNDYKIINDKIEDGKAHELSESDTIYLGACTKGSTAAKSWVTQYYNSEEKAKKRAYCLKNSYMTYVLNNYIVPGVRTYEESIVTIEELQHESFSDIIMGKLSKYEGMTEDNIAKELGIEVNKKNKSYEASLVYKMLGVKNRCRIFEIPLLINVQNNCKLINNKVIKIAAYSFLMMIVAYKASGLQLVYQLILTRQLPVEIGILILIPPAVEPNGTYRAIVGEQLRQLVVHKLIIARPVAFGVRTACPPTRASPRIVFTIPVEV